MKLRSVVCGLLVAGLSLSFGTTSFAQKKKEKKKEAPVQTYNFSGDDIDGELVKPDGDYIGPRDFANHMNLIRIRQDFIKEILKSAEDL